MLIDHGLALRHDWEKVVTPVVDAVLKLEGVDSTRIAYQAWSLGGYMAPRVTAFEPRLAAVVCDPGQIDVGVNMLPVLRHMGLSEAAFAELPALSPDDRGHAHAGHQR